MPKLIHIEPLGGQGQYMPTFMREIRNRLHDNIMAIPTPQALPNKELQIDGTNLEASLFLVNDADVEVAATHLAQQFPGRGIAIYNMEANYIAPAAEVVKRKVTKNGLLPA